MLGERVACRYFECTERERERKRNRLHSACMMCTNFSSNMSEKRYFLCDAHARGVVLCNDIRRKTILFLFLLENAFFPNSHLVSFSPLAEFTIPPTSFLKARAFYAFLEKKIQIEKVSPFFRLLGDGNKELGTIVQIFYESIKIPLMLSDSLHFTLNTVLTRTQCSLRGLLAKKNL